MVLISLILDEFRSSYNQIQSDGFFLGNPVVSLVFVINTHKNHAIHATISYHVGCIDYVLHLHHLSQSEVVFSPLSW